MGIAQNRADEAKSAAIARCWSTASDEARLEEEVWAMLQELGPTVEEVSINSETLDVSQWNVGAREGEVADRQELVEGEGQKPLNSGEEWDVNDAPLAKVQSVRLKSPQGFISPP